MWIFAPGGLLMPSTFPKDKVDPAFMDAEGTYDLQIRARTESHLTNFVRDYVTPLSLSASAIQATPGMDYNFRLYMSRKDFATAMANMVMDIDYKKFKPTAEDKAEDGTPLYADGRQYHNVLNSIWSTVCTLGRPGGVWGPYSSINTAGYKPHTTTWKGGSGRRYRDTAWGRGYSSDLSDTYYDGDLYPEFRRPTSRDDSWWDDYRAEQKEYATLADEIGQDYVPAIEERKIDILLTVEGIPASQWDEFLTVEEMNLVKAEHKSALTTEKRTNRKRHRKAGRPRYGLLR